MSPGVLPTESAPPITAKKAHTPKLLALQVLRAAATILVLWLHALGDVRASGLKVVHVLTPGLATLGSVGVDIFFCLSGLVVSLSAARGSEPGRFALRRFIRIYPIFWLSLALVVVFAGASQEGRFGSFGARVLWSSTLTASPFPARPLAHPIVLASWTLVFEVFFYACLWGGLVARRIDPRIVCALIVGAFLTVNLALGHRVPILSIYGSPFVIEFLFGIAIGAFLSLKAAKPWAIALIGLGVALLLASVLLTYNPRFVLVDDMLENPIIALQRVLLWGIPSALLVAGGATLGWQPRNALGRTAVFLGDACFSIYIFQWIPLTLIQAYIVRRFAGLGGDFAVFITVVGCTAFGAGIYAFVERPLTRWLNGRLIRKESVVTN